MIFKKDWYQSKTIVAIIGLVVLLINRHFGIIIVEWDIFEILGKATELLLAILAIYGRMTAEKEIK